MKTQYNKKYYINLTKEEIKKELTNQKFKPLHIVNSPGYEYEAHEHPQTKILAITKGDMNVSIKNHVYKATKGDRFLISANTPHKATVGKKGCSFFWAEKLSKKQT